MLTSYSRYIINLRFCKTRSSPYILRPLFCGGFKLSIKSCCRGVFNKTLYISFRGAADGGIYTTTILVATVFVCSGGRITFCYE